jgi:hypothetical protein
LGCHLLFEPPVTDLLEAVVRGEPERIKARAMVEGRDLDATGVEPETPHHLKQ